MQTNGLAINAGELIERLSLGRYGTSHHGSRDYYDILGYPRQLGIGDYLVKYERDALAGRIVEFPPDETWRDIPTVKDGRDKDAQEETPFAHAWSDFAERKRVYHYCQRVDTLCGIGRFAVLLIGVAGSGELESEVTRVNSIDDILYLRPYGEQSVDIAEYEDDPQNARFGMPRIYTVTIADADGKQTVQRRVHASRVIHVAESLLENDVYGAPRLQRVYNLLDDILKIVGGSAEATWLLMRKGFVLNIDPETELDAESKASIEAEFEEYEHGLRRFMKTRGVTVSDLGSEVVDPSGPFGVIISLIAAATGIPQRILLGSERGELASSQDASHWAGRIANRQLQFAEPMILRPLIDRLITWGALPPPATSHGHYSVVWQPLFELNDQEKANVALMWADAMQKLMTVYTMPPITMEEWRGEWSPFPAEVPVSAVEPAPPAQPAAIPGQDVLEQVSQLVSSGPIPNGNGDQGAPRPLGEAMMVQAVRDLRAQLVRLQEGAR